MENPDLIITNLLQQAANNRVEIKANASLDDIAQTITAFINGHGGDFLLGVDENKKVVGLVNAQQYRMTIRDYLSKNISPIAPISINLIIYNSKPLILINAWEGAQKPYFLNEKICLRKNGQNYQDEGTNLDFDEMSKGVETKLMEIYNFIRDNGVANTSDIVELTNKSVATVKRYLKILKEKEMIRFVGSRNRKIGGYKIVDVDTDMQ